MTIIHKIRDSIKRIDLTIGSIVAFLILSSLVLIYSSTGKLAVLFSDGDSLHYLIRHATMLAIGVGVLLLFNMINYHTLQRWSFVLLLVSYAFVGYAVLFGTDVNGASRWIEIPFIGLTFQPSELAKISIVLWTAFLIRGGRRSNYCSGKVIKRYAWSVGGLLFLILFENFSTSVLIGITSLMMFIVGGVKKMVLFKWVSAISVIGLIGLFCIFQFPDQISFGRTKTIKARIERYIGGSDDVTGKDSQEIRSKLALAGGGLIGAGPGNSIQRNYLPHPYSDFIYAIVIEEYGLIIGLIILLAYIGLLTRVGVILRKCDSTYAAMVIVGLGVMITFQALVHIGVCVGFFPVTGQPLPFISMGGTSLAFTGATIGIILSINNSFSMSETQGKEMDEESYSDEGYGEYDEYDEEYDDGFDEEYDLAPDKSGHDLEYEREKMR